MAIRTLAVIVVATATLYAASMLGVAVAEAPTSTPLRTVGVEGVASVPVGQTANSTSATAAYREAMAAAVSDGQGKATFLAEKTGATLGPVQSVGEAGGEIFCLGANEADEYEGEQPDFGYAQQLAGASTPEVASSAPSTSSRPTVRKVGKRSKQGRKKHKRPTAKKATAASCKLSAQVALVYALS